MEEQIQSVKAREILDSRGNPTLDIFVCCCPANRRLMHSYINCHLF